jgi:threonine synthase
VEIATARGWGFVNVNLRPYYGEGSKTIGYELAEQGGWSLPRHVVAPMAGGCMIGKVARAFRELVELGLVEDAPVALHGAQAAGCAPIVSAWRTEADTLRPVRPDTIVRSLAIGDPADGLSALETIRGSGGRAEDPSDAEALEGIRLLAETEGLFSEAAGGVVVAAASRLARQGAFASGGRVVLLITGHGLKTAESLGAEPFSGVIDPKLEAFDDFWSRAWPASAAV